LVVVGEGGLLVEGAIGGGGEGRGVRGLLVVVKSLAILYEEANQHLY
jgi:hypothetical protein